MSLDLFRGSLTLLTFYKICWIYDENWNITMTYVKFNFRVASKDFKKCFMNISAHLYII